MPDTFTANYNFTKPEVNASRDTWGTKNNANLDALDGILFSMGNGALQKTGGTVTGLVNFTGAAPQIGGSAIPTTAAVATMIANAINAMEPIGTVKGWGLANTALIPAGWQLCDGTNGTVDMRDKFPIGAGQTYAFNSVGGALTHDHGGFTVSYSLTLAELPSHSHPVSDPGHNHPVTDPGHNHSYGDYYSPNSSSSPGGAGTIAQFSSDVARTTGDRTTGISVGANFTGISTVAVGSGTAHRHPISASTHLPPYRGLYFIQRVA